MKQEGSQGGIIGINEGLVQRELGEAVRETVEEALNRMLDAGADEFCKATGYEHMQCHRH